ncbi:MAG: hypothetical protein IID13_03885 [Candidatus Marinimicrobia bacterium]|nr:hypothetical protein [Candidatus Neomarinimicrobiota bacterium]
MRVIDRIMPQQVLVYELLDQKFRLFSGVFGASDEVLGALESGVNFEKRIASIYQECRTAEQIQFEFDDLQRELETEIAAGQRDARDKLLDNFDQEVVEKVRIQSHDILDRFNEQLWGLTRHILADYAHFDETGYSFELHSNPFPGESIHPGPYRMAKDVEDANTYRVGHPLAQRVLERGMALETAPETVTFDLAGSGKNIAALEALIGQSGWLACSRLTLSALETEDRLIFAGVSDNGMSLEETQCRRLFDLPSSSSGPVSINRDVDKQLEEAQLRRQQVLVEELTARNGNWFDMEMDKLDRWAEDRRAALKSELDELDEALREAKKQARLAPTLPEKLERQRAARTLEAKREEAWRAYDEAGRDIDRQKDGLLDEISRRLEQQIDLEPLFTLRWQLV